MISWKRIDKKRGLSTKLKAGSSNMDGLIILAALIIIVIIMPKGSPDSSSDPLPSRNSNTSSENKSTPSSLYERSISLGTGNAAYAYQTYEEYITIDNRGREPINISGWSLKNGKSKRAYNFGGDLEYFASDIATIGQAALFIAPDNRHILQDVILKPGEKAIVTTGSMGSQSPYKIVGFKENSCSGYLGKMPEYKFTPSLARNCPRPSDEIGVTSLDTECRKFIERMPSCRTPEFDTRDRDGEICYGCVDGKLLSSTCVAFIKNHFNYNSCIANHQNDPDFSSRTWRIFLGRGWEMWAREYETIELFDQLGRLVKSRTY